jgi:hypothetical protein
LPLTTSHLKESKTPKRPDASVTKGPQMAGLLQLAGRWRAGALCLRHHAVTTGWILHSRAEEGRPRRHGRDYFGMSWIFGLWGPRRSDSNLSLLTLESRQPSDSLFTVSFFRLLPFHAWGFYTAATMRTAVWVRMVRTSSTSNHPPSSHITIIVHTPRARQSKGLSCCPAGPQHSHTHTQRRGEHL